MIAMATVAGAAEAQACTFQWHGYGENGIKERVSQKIGDIVTNRYCNLYNKGYEIVLIFDSYSNATQSVGHATAGIRKRGSQEVPSKRMSAYRSSNGNYTQAYAMDLAARSSIDALTEIMDDIDAYVPSQKYDLAPGIRTP